MNSVVDASSLAALFLPDEDSSLIERYLNQAEIVAAPKLAIVETAAAFFRRVRKGSLTLSQAEAAANSWKQNIESGGIQFHEDASVLSEACATAGHLQHALQDCIYLELARKLSYTLITGDRVFAKRPMLFIHKSS
jgi:predicted nucleic acid-binding protein